MEGTAKKVIGYVAPVDHRTPGGGEAKEDSQPPTAGGSSAHSERNAHGHANRPSS